jgi:hypothetical protein
VPGSTVCQHCDLLGEPHEGELLGEQGMVLHSHCETGSALVEDISEIYQRRSEGNRIDSENCENVEFNRENLVCTDDFYGNFHCKLLIFIFWRSPIVLFYQVFLAVRENSAVRSELKPNVESSLALNVAESGVEFQVLLETSGEEELQLHGLSASVMKNDFFTIELFVN